jgi:hypothetical protein
MGSVQFVGQEPYVLPTPQHTKVHPLSDGVEVHIRLAESPRSLYAAVLRLTTSQALLLVKQLSEAVQQQ